MINEFRRLYIQSELFDIKYSDYIGSAFRYRGSSDYDDFFLASKDETLEQLEHAKELVAAVEDFLQLKAK